MDLLYFEVNVLEDTAPLSLLSSYYNSMWVSLHPGCGPVLMLAPCAMLVMVVTSCFPQEMLEVSPAS